MATESESAAGAAPGAAAAPVTGDGTAGIQHRAQLLGQLAELGEPDHPARAAEGLLEALVIEGLHEVIDCRHIEGIERVAVVRGHEDRRRHVLRADVAHDFETGATRHLHVQEHQVGLQGADGLDRRIAVVGEAGDFDAFLVTQQILEALASEGLVIDDENA